MISKVFLITCIEMSSHPEAFPDLSDWQISVNSAILVGF